jgi:hypothetical protein
MLTSPGVGLDWLKQAVRCAAKVGLSALEY